VHGDSAWAGLDAWPDATVGEPLGGGSINAVREVQVGGRRRVARISSRGAEDLEWEVRLLVRLSHAGLGVPRLVPTRGGSVRSGRMIVTEWVDGVEPATTTHWAAVSGYLRRLHDATAGWSEQRPGWRGCTELVTATRSGPVDLTALPSGVLATCRRTWSRLPPRPPVVIHGDPNPTNIRVQGDGSIVFLDWDEARLDNELLDSVYLPPDLSGLTPEEQAAGQQAFYAWEAAMFWERSPEHAAKRLASVRTT
jgi:Ser/Thr protein kinase RdoA (MazF antagonist)